MPRRRPRPPIPPNWGLILVLLANAVFWVAFAFTLWWALHN